MTFRPGGTRGWLVERPLSGMHINELRALRAQAYPYIDHAVEREIKRRGQILSHLLSEQGRVPE